MIAQNKMKKNFFKLAKTCLKTGEFSKGQNFVNYKYLEANFLKIKQTCDWDKNVFKLLERERNDNNKCAR